MGYTFQRAPSFTSGSSLSAENIAKLADAFNSRIKTGVGDCSRRVHQAIMNSMRNPRNPVDEFTFGSQLEQLTYYNHVPNDGEDLYYDAEAGEPAGANLGNPVNEFVFGNPELFGEADRLSSLIILDPDATTGDRWELAKYQRGGYDSASLLAYQPFNSASQEHFRIGAFPFSFFLKSPGGFLPTPLVLGTCTDSLTDPTIVFPNQQIKFTKLSDSSVVTYGGTCGPSYGGVDTDVANVIEFPFEWRVYLFNGTIDVYPKSEYVQGPYEGSGQLAKDNFDFLNRAMLQSYVKEFKGWDTYQIENISASTSPYPIQKFGCHNILSASFDFENVINRPWQLSPAYAEEEGGNLVIKGYPSASIFSDKSEGHLFNVYILHEHFVAGGYYMSATNLSQSVTVQTWVAPSIYAGPSVLINEFTLPTGSSGDATFYETCDTFKRQITGSIYFKLKTPLVFSGSGQLYCEFSELYEAYPQVYDLYTYLRMSTALGSIDPDLTNDQMAPDEDQCKLISDNYDHYGACINVNGSVGVIQPLGVINTNPPYDSLRRMIRGNARYVKKEYLSGYEVQGGKSILYFSKFLETDPPDVISMWDGMLNPFDSGSNGVILNATGSWSNEWVMDVGLKPTNPSDSSIWKDDSYYWWGINRALFLNSLIPNNYPDIYGFVTDGGSLNADPGNLILTNPEYGITYLNYINSVNVSPGQLQEVKIDFLKSCQMYEEPAYIEDIRAVANNEIKITFNKRLHHSDQAPETINRGDNGFAAWGNNENEWQNETMLWAEETYRTTENAIRDYLRTGGDLDNNAIPVRIGDHSNRSVFSFFTDQPNGMIPETFLFLKLIPHPYTGSISATGCCDRDDEDATTLSAETLVQMEFYLRSICEGFVDGNTPFVCTDFDSTTAYDYTFANLCFQAFSGSHLTFPNPLRTDNGTNYGGLPTFFCYAKTLQQISSCVNLLTDVRLPLPFLLETKECNYIGTAEVTPNVYLNGSTCAGSFVGGVIFSTSGPGATTLTGECSDWTELTPSIGGDYVFGGGTSTGLNADGICSDDGIRWIMVTSRQATQYRFQLQDPDNLNAISPELQDNVTNGSSNGFFGLFEDFIQTATANAVGTQPESKEDCQSTSIFWDGSTGYASTINTTDNFSCRVFKDGIIDLGPSAPASAVFLCRNRGVDPDAFSGGGGIHSQAIRVMSLNTLVVGIPLVN